MPANQSPREVRWVPDACSDRGCYGCRTFADMDGGGVRCIHCKAEYRLPTEARAHFLPRTQGGGGAHYMSDRFEFAAPGDRQEPLWILRFDDADLRDAHFHTAEEAWAAWDRYATAWNCQLFETARLRPANDLEAELAQLRAKADAMAGVVSHYLAHMLT